MQRGIEAQTRSQSALSSIPRIRPSEEVGLGTLPQARFRELFNRLSHIRINNQHKVTSAPTRRKKNRPQLSNPAHTWRKGSFASSFRLYF